jgi:hypothetical protein
MLTSKVYQAFCFHVFVIMETVKELHTKIDKAGGTANIRIGHGIAFLFGHDHVSQDLPPKPLSPPKTDKNIGVQLIKKFIANALQQNSDFIPIAKEYAPVAIAITCLAAVAVLGFGSLAATGAGSTISSSPIGTNISKVAIEQMNQYINKDKDLVIDKAVQLQIDNEACVEYLVAELQKFREEYLEDTAKSKKIVCELCPTSNNMLLSSSFDASNHNIRTLRTFLDLNLAVTLSTDDDGVRRINKCKAHNHHTSLAAEYCEAIVNGDIQTEDELDRMINRGISAAFLN